MELLAAQLPVRNYVDHGPTIEPQPGSTAFLKDVYPGLVARAKHTVARPGDRLAVGALDWRIVTSGGNVLKQALPGGGRPNPYCAAFTPQQPDKTENAQSVGSVIAYGSFRVAHLGDLTWNKEHDLMCPRKPIGTVDLFIVSHHGQAISNAPVLVHALAPRVMVMNNGTRKGGQPDAMKVLHASPGLEDLWQAHFSELSGQEYTVPGMFIANTIDEQPAAMPIAPFVPPARAGGPAAPAPAAGAAAAPRAGGAPGGGAPVHNGQAYWIKIAAKQDGSFTVTNVRNGFTKTYAAR